jgi:hypothetical protein
MRAFRAEELFADERLTVALHKPCPYCGHDEELRFSRFSEPFFMSAGEPGINVPLVLAHLGPPIDGESDETLTAHFEADQSSRRELRMSAADDRVRLRYVLSALVDRALLTPADYHHAAMILHHGPAREHTHLAYELARRAAEAGYRPARWLAAAALDRWLMHAGLPQKYGTQFHDVHGSYQLWMVDPTTTDEERVEWDVPPLAQQQERARDWPATRRQWQPPVGPPAAPPKNRLRPRPATSRDD